MTSRLGEVIKLADLIDRINLPDLIARECGPQTTHGLNRERGGTICDPRPGRHETHPSFSVYMDARGRGRWKRHGGGDDDQGDALDFLESMGHSPSQAREELARHAGVTLDARTPGLDLPAYVAPDPLAKARAALNHCTPLTAEEMERLPNLISPLTPTDAAAYELARRGLYGWTGLQVGRLRQDYFTWQGKVLAHAGGLTVLIVGPDSEAMGLKVRNLGSKAALKVAGLGRYIYRLAGHGSPAWCSPGYGGGEATLIVEGELNGAAAACAFEVMGLYMDVQGLAAAGGTPFLHGLHEKVVYLYLDPDTAGAAGLNRLGALVRAAGARAVRVLSPLPEGDFCDFAGTAGRAALGARLIELLSRASLWHSNIPGNPSLPESFAALRTPENDSWQSGGSIRRGGW